VSAGSGAPGTAALIGGTLRVACGGGTALELLEVQPEGKKRMAARDFVNGLPTGGLVLGA
jgi:methionyl-tRNA formyltransferase